ncbi:hypothetical protein PV04_08902 [Phialophora macrospora]|uniref:Uncharacterized protein n=1 Tax=Phialophora macrospora TaxID=1851006 RepID=A0A0D2FV87_9EURO|nr:hypothetical protein PV04_08902 [Phialophora macrospora]
MQTEGRQSRTSKIVPVEAPAEALLTGEPSSAELESKLAARSKPYQQWLSPTALHIIIPLLSIVSFCGLLVPYTQYTRVNKAVQHEICKEDARTLYENSLAQCDVKATTSLRGGALGLNWLEIGMVVATAVAWCYVTWLAQRWLVVRISSLRKDHKK